MNHLKHPLLMAGVALLLAAEIGHARWIKVTEPVPVDRLAANVARYVKEHPADAEGYYTLGRIHSLAFARGTATVEVIPAGSKYKREKPELPGFAGYDSVQVRREKSEAPLSDALVAHLKASVANYAKASELAPTNALYLLGYGWMLEQGAPYASKIGAPWDDNRKKQAEVKSADWLEKSLAVYRKAFDLTVESDAGRMRGPKADSAISIEAGQGIFRIYGVSQHPSEADQKKTDAEMQEITRVRVGFAKVIVRPTAVTPIIVPLGRETSLRGLLAPGKSVRFDLAGDGLGKRWPWVKPDTGILVWDPQQSGKITSGRQLFGSVTWWIFWKNGYDALAALDNDGNGLLTGRELDGISIWRDGNGNGVSDFGEVKSLEEWDIRAIATRASRKIEGVPANLRGCLRSDGTWLPTYDWTPQSLD